MVKQVETIERQHKCTKPHALTGSITLITHHLEPFIGICVNLDPLRQTYRVAIDCAYTRCRGTCSPWYWEQSRYKHQASVPPTWCKPKDGYLYPTWQLLLSLSPPTCAGIITGGFSLMVKILSLIWATDHHHYEISVFSPLHLWSDLLSRWHH